MNVVDLGSSSDDGDDNEKGTSSSQKNNHSLEFRSFWKAGGYDVGLTKSLHEQALLEHARVHPKFLHSNATSHKWAFGAIAELLDNAVDEISKGATFVKLDRIYNPKDHSPALLFRDDGGGMDPESLRQCMSLGYSNKKATAIGQYGNGFKTSTMRLGADVIVFSRKSHGSHSTQSIGLLSYTFLRKTGQDDVIVPMIDYESLGDRRQPIIHSSLNDWSCNLGTILEWSPFASEQELMLQFEDLGAHGTKIVVYNLWLNDDGLLELDFDADEEDIRLRDEVSKSLKKRDVLIESHISYHIRFSLRAYASVLYLRRFKNFSIILRGKPVQQYSIADDLKYMTVVMYRPQLAKASKEVSVKTKIGFAKEAPELPISGFNVYHKNRLIRPFWKVTNDGSSRGNGVIGVLEANFIEPAHDKQDFERSALFIRLETRLKQMIIDFCLSYGWAWIQESDSTGLGFNGPRVWGSRVPVRIVSFDCLGWFGFVLVGWCPYSVVYWKSHFHFLGARPQIPYIRNMQKECPIDVANVQSELATGQPVIGLSANMQQGMNLDHPVIGLAANMHVSSNGQQTSDMYRDFSDVQPIIGLAADSQMQANARNQREGSGHPGSSKDGTGSALVDQICDENIELFMRCEQHREKETDLKQTIEELEKEIEETKRKCSQISSRLESQRKHRTIREQTEKA
ncbi:hypothetical protein IFM89_037330 [Coptis chinensis]|uniref:Morc S5 domain-containing protein n=1 Tax=Coptis chinensis TaxID=261450 RepID=A0A835LY27_9MAGN|nr:hypothetical protein IFM89_037330 [Coptis chinensis]